MPDRNDGGVREPGREQRVQRGLRRLVERGGGFVEKQEIRRLQDRARDRRAAAARRATGSGSSALPRRAARRVAASRPRSGSRRAGRRRTSPARPDSSPRPPASRPGNRAAAASPSHVRPPARGWCRFRTARSPRSARNSVDLPAPDGPVTSTLSPGAISTLSAATSGWPFGSCTEGRRSPSTCGRRAPATPMRGLRRGGLRLRDRGIEAVEPGDHRAPFREIAVDVDEDESASRTLSKARGGLHQPAELDLAGEIGGAHHDVREHRRDLPVARGQEGQPLQRAHDLPPVGDHEGEPVLQARVLRGLALAASAICSEFSRTRTRLKRKSASYRCCRKFSPISGLPIQCVTAVPTMA